MSTYHQHVEPDAGSVTQQFREAGIFIPQTPVERAIVWLLNYKEPGLTEREFYIAMTMGLTREEAAGALAVLRERQMLIEQEEDHRQSDGSFRREVVIRLWPVDEIP